MKLFLDTSSLIKLYHAETGTEELDDIIETGSIDEIFLSYITIIEFSSAIWKKVRTKELSKEIALEITGAFSNDFSSYTLIPVSNDLIFQAKELVSKYANKGLRTLDSIQLASIISVKNDIAFAISADNLLNSIINLEGIKTV